MTETPDLYKIDPATIDSGLVGLSETTLVAKGKDGNTWFQLVGSVSREFQMTHLKSKGEVTETQLGDYVREARKRFSDRLITEEAQDRYSLGPAVALILFNSLRFDHHDVGLWVKVKQGSSVVPLLARLNSK